MQTNATTQFLQSQLDEARRKLFEVRSRRVGYWGCGLDRRLLGRLHAAGFVVRYPPLWEGGPA